MAAQLRDFEAQLPPTVRPVWAGVGAQGGGGETEHGQGLSRAILLAVVTLAFGEPVGHVRCGPGARAGLFEQAPAQGV